MRMYRIIFARNVNYVMLGLAFAHLWTLSIQQGDCNFDTNMCGFQQDTTDDFDWTRQQGSTGTSNTGPSADHTTGSGYYMFIETSSPQETGHIARLISPSLSSDIRCLEFWYHMYGDSTDDLNVYIRQTGRPLQGSLAWSQTGDKGDVWKRARVHVEEASDFSVVFEGVRGSSYRGDIAIDDVSFRTTPCGGDCTFDATVCGYQQDSTDDFDWTRQQRSTGSSFTGPSSDHTTGTALGSYMFIETSTPRQPGDIARLISPVLSPDIRCLEFWYHMYGDGIGELRVYQSSTGSSQLGTPLWSLAGNQGNVWHNATMGLVPGSSFNIVFEAVRGSTARGDIAIDDVSGRTTSCGGPVVTTAMAAAVTTVTVATVGESTFNPATAATETTTPLQVTTPEPSTQHATTEMASTTPVATTPGPTTTEAVPSERDCDFFMDICGYQQDNTDDFDWTRKYGSTSTSGTGPSSDHTGNGYYMYIEASSPQVQGDIARLMTPALPTNTRCLEFWYHMYGSSTGELRVYRRPTGSPELGAPIWSLAGDQGNVWDQARLDITAVNNFQIVFEGVRGSNMYGDIAIDDVSFRSTPCGDGSCTFDIDPTLCGYQQDNTDDFDWTRQQGSTGTANTGPSSDHTTGSGYYIYIETSGQQSGDIARLISLVLSSDTRCLEFWYHMYGDHTEELNIYLRSKGSADLGTPVWSQTGNQGDVWKQATVDLVADRNFYVVFEGVRGTSYRGDIAIDDVSYRTTPCVATTVAITTTTVATTSQRTTTDIVTTNPVTTAATTTTLLQTTTSTNEPSIEDTTTEGGHTTPGPSTTYITTTISVTTQEATTTAATTPDYTSTAMDTTTDATSTHQALTTTKQTTASFVTTDATTLELTTSPDTTSVMTTDSTLELTTSPDTTSVIITEVTTLELTTETETTTILPTTITTTQHTSSLDVQPTTSLEETTETSTTTTVDNSTPLKSTTHVATTIEEETTPGTTVTSSTVFQTTDQRETTTPTHEHSSASTNIATTQKPVETTLPSALMSTTKLHPTTTTKSSTVKPDEASTATLSTLKPEQTKPLTKKPVTVQPESEAQDGGLSIGIIIGAGAGGAVAVILVVVVIVVVFKCRKSNRRKNEGWEAANPMYDVAMGPMKNGNKPGYGGDVYSNNNKNGGKMDEDFYAFNMDTSNV